jgi:hypothetical protein
LTLATATGEFGGKKNYQHPTALKLTPSVPVFKDSIHAKIAIKVPLLNSFLKTCY